jgi:hypothetical protein
LLNQKENQNIQVASFAVAGVVVENELICGILAYAEFVLGSWPIMGRFLALQNQVGKYNN